LRVQRVVMPSSASRSWTVLDRSWSVIEPAEAFLAHLHVVERSPKTVKAYAHDLRDWFEFLDGAGVAWSAVQLEDVGRFVAWLRLPPQARDGRVVALPSAEGLCAAATVNRKLSAVSAFYEFHQRHGVELGGLLVTWRSRPSRAGSWRPLLAHLGSRSERRRTVKLRAVRRIPAVLDADQIEAVLRACLKGARSASGL
jgi:integrase/recombinase XerD